MHKTNTTQTDKTYLTETRNIVTEIWWCHQISPSLKRRGGTRSHWHLVFYRIYNCYRAIKYHLINWMHQQFKMQGPVKERKIRDQNRNGPFQPP